MKCPQCDNAHRHKYGMTCSCGYRFCFDPKVDRMTDGKFLAAIHSASNNDAYYFTENQLYADICRRKVKGRRIPLVGALMGLLTNPPTLREERSYVRKWEKSGRKIEKLIDVPRLHDPPPQWKEPDIYDYGVERLLIVQRDLLVDLFVLNGFHSQQRALILSESGYPKYLLPRAAKALQDNPQTPVFLLHDSTQEGLGMLSRVRASSLPIEGHPVIDLGVTPEEMHEMRGLKPTKPGRQNFAVPVDLLLYGTLTAAIAQCFDQNLTLAALLARSQEGSDDGYSSFG